MPNVANHEKGARVAKSCEPGAGGREGEAKPGVGP